MKFKKTFLFLASQKMDINGSNLVLEKDGTEITDDEILLLLQQETLRFWIVTKRGHQH